MSGSSNEANTTADAVVSDLLSAVEGAGDSTRKCRAKGRGKWLIGLAALAIGAALAAYKRSADKPDPWATAIPYVPPTTSGTDAPSEPAASASESAVSADEPVEDAATAASEVSAETASETDAAAAADAQPEAAVEAEPDAEEAAASESTPEKDDDTKV